MDIYLLKSYDFYYELRALPFVEGIYLYGSRSRQDAQGRSDIDLAIVCPQATDQDWQKILEIIEGADTLLEIDCVRWDTLNDTKLKHAIDHDKQVLFERKQTNYVWYETFLDLGEALEKLEGALKEDISKGPYAREAAIQIFEYSFELFWKVLKHMCVEEGFEVASPRSALQKAYALRLIDDEDVWIKMMSDRNLTSHTYKQPLAKEIVSHLGQYVAVMKKAYAALKQKYHL